MINKAVYTNAPVASGWAGAVMIWAGACSNTNFPTLKMPKNAKKQIVTGQPTDRPTDMVTYRSRARKHKGNMSPKKWCLHELRWMQNCVKPRRPAARGRKRTLVEVSFLHVPSGILKRNFLLDSMTYTTVPPFGNLHRCQVDFKQPVGFFFVAPPPSAIWLASCKSMERDEFIIAFILALSLFVFMTITLTTTRRWRLW